MGCGYGTFTIPIAQAIGGTLYAFDVEPEMIARTKERASNLRIVCGERDVVESGFGVQVDAALLFNILHTEQPVKLLRHAAAAAPYVLAIHWRFSETSRSLSLEIRPKPEQIIEWGLAAGLEPVGGTVDLPPWRYGVTLSRRKKNEVANTKS